MITQTTAKPQYTLRLVPGEGFYILNGTRILAHLSREALMAEGVAMVEGLNAQARELVQNGEVR